MIFGDWEVDDDIFAQSASQQDETQESRSAREARLAALSPSQQPIDDDDPLFTQDMEPDITTPPHTDEVLSLIDATNGFNNLSRYRMLSPHLHHHNDQKRTLQPLIHQPETRLRKPRAKAAWRTQTTLPSPPPQGRTMPIPPHSCNHTVGRGIITE